MQKPRGAGAAGIRGGGLIGVLEKSAPYLRALVLALGVAVGGGVAVEAAVGSSAAPGAGSTARTSSGPPPVENECVPALRLDSGWCGDGGPAVHALMDAPVSVASLPGGGFIFAEQLIGVIRRVRPDGVIEVAAGTGTPGFAGDGGPGRRAQISASASVAALRSGGFLIADVGNNRVRRVSAEGIITTIAGTGKAGFGGDGGPATQAALARPESVASLPDGGVLIADAGNRRIRRVGPDGVITTVAGGGESSADDGPATSASLGDPVAVAPLADGGFVFVDNYYSSMRLLRVTANGTIATVLLQPRLRGTGFVGTREGLVLAVSGQAWRVSPDGQATRLAGLTRDNFRPGPLLPGDGGPAADAPVYVAAIAVTPDDALLVADSVFARIRQISPSGTITTVAGGGGKTGPILPSHNPPCENLCGGLRQYPPWNYFHIERIVSTRGGVRLRIGTTLAADVVVTARRRGGTVARRALHIVAGRPVIRLGHLRPGRYRFEARGRHGPLRATSGASARVRR